MKVVHPQLCTLVLAVAGLIVSPAVLAEAPLELTGRSFMELDEQLKSAKGHPNEEWRLRGLQSYQDGRYEEAVERFERAATYADKYAQHYLSLIYWHGQGVAPDRVRAYIWSDLAAERGNRRLLAIRENMWARLSPEEQAQVAAQGAEFYERYGDPIAKPRAESEIRRFARNMTGSRIGYSSQQVDIAQGGPINGSFGNASPSMLLASEAVVGTTTEQQFYAEERTRMAAYWREQDALIERGDVNIGPVTAQNDQRRR